MGKAKKEKNRIIREQSNGGLATSTVASNLKVKGENFYRDAKKEKLLNRHLIKARMLQSQEYSQIGDVIGQKQLEDFRESLGTKVNDPYQVLLRQNKLPMSLLIDPAKISRMHMVDTEPFSDTFGPKAQRKRPKLNVGSLEDLVNSTSQSLEHYEEKNDQSLLSNKITDWIDEARDNSSDVVIHVLDARDPI
ncbi:13836_t:CDS:2, partial [Racocetra fulgida]